jgi:hypothetical protein
MPDPTIFELSLSIQSLDSGLKLGESRSFPSFRLHNGHTGPAGSWTAALGTGVRPGGGICIRGYRASPRPYQRSPAQREIEFDQGAEAGIGGLEAAGGTNRLTMYIQLW